MNDKELRALTDEALESKINSLAPTIRQRTIEGGITVEGANALKEALPLYKERERRAEVAERERRSKALADLDEALTEKQERTRRLFKLCGNTLN